MRVTFGEAKAEIARVPNANLCATDTRAGDLVNRAVRRIVESGRSDLLHRRIRMCIDNNCVTFPRGVAAVTDAAICNSPIPVRNGWYEFLPKDDGVFTGSVANQSGVGYTWTDCPSSALHFRKEVAFFKEIEVSASTLKIYTDVDEAADAHVMVYGYDRYDRKVRTDWDGDGEPEDGVRIGIAGPANEFTDTTEWADGGLLHLTKTSTRGRVLLYAVHPTTAAETLLSIYESDETQPSYKQYLIRGIDVACSGCQPKTFTAMVKLEWQNAVNDDDLLIVPSLEAIRLMAEACLKFDNNNYGEGNAISVQAMRYFGKVRDHNTPKEQVAVSLRTQGSAYQTRRRIGAVI